MDLRLEAPRERLVDVAVEVAREYGHPREILDALQQIGDLLVGEAIVRGRGRGAFAEQRVRFVEEQDPVAMLGAVEQPCEILLRLADVLRDHEREVDAIDIAPRMLADQRSGQRLSRAGRSVEQAAEAGDRKSTRLNSSHS